METKDKDAKHPMQPLVVVGGVVRFKVNKIVRALLDTGKLNLNDIEALDFPTEDRIQFAQLIGYSVIGIGDLWYIPDDFLKDVDAKAQELEEQLESKV